MNPSKESIEKIIEWEIGDRAYYNKYLSHFTWPGGASGVTVGFGYDLGYYTKEQIIVAWCNKIDGSVLVLMLECAGIKGVMAKSKINDMMQKATIPYDVAMEVFKETILPDEIKKTENTYPGVNELSEDAQGALLSLIYNRGTSFTDSEGKDNRKEMREIAPLVLEKDYHGIAEKLRSMKRLWKGKGLDGLIRRREGEAKLVEAS